MTNYNFGGIMKKKHFFELPQLSNRLEHVQLITYYRVGHKKCEFDYCFRTAYRNYFGERMPFLFTVFLKAARLYGHWTYIYVVDRCKALF